MRADGSVVVGQVNIYTITVGFDCVVSIHIGKDVFKVRSFTKVVRGSRISRFLMMMILVTTVQDSRRSSCVKPGAGSATHSTGSALGSLTLMTGG